MTKKPQTYKKVNLKSVLDIVMSVLFFFLAKDVYPGVPLIVYIILMSLIIIFILAGILSLYDEVYDAECPYCNKTIQIDKDASALDCPICKERIIIEDYTLKKTNHG